MKSAIYINKFNALAGLAGVGKLRFRWQAGLWLGLVILLMQGCASNLYLKENELLLKGDPAFNKVKVERADSTAAFSLESLKELGLSTVDADLLYGSVKTHPNRRMVLPKTYLHLYNLGRTLQRYEYPPERLLNFFLPGNHLVDSLAAFLVRTAGEAPVIIDTAQLRNDVLNLENVYFSQGFFHAKVTYSVDTCKSKINAQKGRVAFLIDEGKAAIIDKVRYEIADEEIRKTIYKNLSESYLRSGDNYVEDNLSAERSRIAAVLRDNGYYTFAPSMVTYEVDTLPPDTLGVSPNNPAIKDFMPIWLTVKVPDSLERWKVGYVSMIMEPHQFDPEVDTIVKVLMPGFVNDSLRKAWKLSESRYSDSSMVTFKAYERVLERMNLNFLEDLIFLYEGEDYSLSNERKTQSRLQNLGIYKYVLLKPHLNESNKTVDYTIQTVMLPRFQFKMGAEGFFENDAILKNNLPGIGGEIGFQDKLLFKGAEKLSISAQGNIRFYRPTPESDIQVFWEGSANASLRFPRLVAPVFTKRNLQGYEPNTTLSATYSRQQSVDVSRNSATLDWSYRWNHSTTHRRVQSEFSPYVINLIQSKLGPRFLDRIKAITSDALRTLIIQDYRQRFSSWGNYKFSYSSPVKRNRPSLITVSNFQMGGNTPYLIDRFGKVDNSYEDYSINAIFYGQYLKASTEFRSNYPIGKHAAFVMRNFLGVAKPWNYTPYVPLESRFFAGGTSGMRGWQSNTLGPGTYQISSNVTDDQGLNFLASPGGELIFENNLELRTDVYKWVKMAFFSDVGNVWFLPGSVVDFEGSKLSKETILQLGVDAGLGLRLDFDFLLFRIDVARKIYAPNLQAIVTKSNLQDLGANRFQLNFGIGYPF